MSTPTPLLTKSTFCKGLQCHKLLYWLVHDKDAPELILDLTTQYRFDEGNEVGARARGEFPEGIFIDLPPWEKKQAIAETLEAMKTGVPAIFEAAFESGGIHVRVDVLERAGRDAWRIAEVKSTTKVKDKHIPDMAVQWHVLESSGVKLAGVDLMHLNRECFYPDLSNLFARSDCTGEVKDFLPSVPSEAEKMLVMLGNPEPPDVPVGPHCSSPYECPFSGRCAPDSIIHHVSELYGKRQKLLDTLEAQGIVTIDQIPGDFPLQEIQRRQRRAVSEGRPIITDALAGRLAEIEYPLYYLDFETFMPAIPRYHGTRPYEHSAVQFSCHVVSADGSMVNHEFLSEADDPRPEIAEHLLDALGTRGTIVSYSPFEKTQINKLADAVPEKRAELESLTPRIWDLCQVLREGVYHPDFRGSFSIKTTYPALCHQAGYHDLEIAEGFEAMVYYKELMKADTAMERKAEIRSNLLAYCKRDTLAMVEVHRAVEGLLAE